MPTDHRRYRPSGLVLVRASTAPNDLPTACDPTATVDEQIGWLADVWSRSRVRDALTVSSLVLAGRVARLLQPDADRSARTIRRLVLAVTSYMTRWERRATPFGLFAGVTAATTGPATGRIGDRHTAVVRADGDWLARVVDRLDSVPGLRRRLMVIADNGGIVRDGRLIVAARPQPGQRSPGPIREVSTRYTRPVATAVTHARRPVPFDWLAAQLVTHLPADPGKVEALLHTLVDGGFLITDLRPPTTTVDGLARVLAVLHAAGARNLAECAPLVDQLAAIHEQIHRHNVSRDGAEQAEVRAGLAVTMTDMFGGDEYPLVVDVRLDATVSVPAAVLDEAARAADVLLRVTTQPFGAAAWLDYHTRFRDRYGPGALIPVRDLVADSGLGYPPGFLGAARARPAWRICWFVRFPSRTPRHKRDMLAYLTRANLMNQELP